MNEIETTLGTILTAMRSMQDRLTRLGLPIPDLPARHRGFARRDDDAHHTGGWTPATGPTDADLASGSVSLYLDEAASTLKVRVKFSNGTTLKTATIALA